MEKAAAGLSGYVTGYRRSKSTCIIVQCDLCVWVSFGGPTRGWARALFYLRASLAASQFFKMIHEMRSGSFNSIDFYLKIKTSETVCSRAYEARKL